MEASAYPDSYYTATCNTTLSFDSLKGDIDIDVCVIGGGYTGLSSALHLAQAGYSVVLLEAHKAGWGASGRNGGQVCTGVRKNQDELEQMVGQDAAVKLWQLAQASKAKVKSLIKEFLIDCDYKPGIAHPDHKARYAKGTKQYVDKLNREYDYPDIEYLNPAEMTDLTGSEQYFGGSLDMGAAHLHPLNYALGLAVAARSLGAQLYEHTEVIRYEAGDTTKVVTANGVVRANRVVLAGNAYLGNLEPKLSGQIMPINNFMLATEPLDDELLKRVNPRDVAIADSRFVVNYYRLSSDKRLLFGGGENYRASFPKDIASFVSKPMLQIYPFLSKLKIDYAWGGALAVTLNRMPHFGTLESGRVVFAQGYSGQGVALSSLAGQLIAEKIAGENENFDLMAKLPIIPFPGGKWLRWPGMVVGMSYYALRDRL